MHPPRVSDAADKGQITLSSSIDTKESITGYWLALIYEEAFTRLGYEFRYIGYPGGRAPYLAERGEIDGEIHRPAEYQQQTQNLLKVPESHFSFSYEAYAFTPGILLDGWDSLRGTHYRVEYRRGAKLPELALAKVVDPTRLSTISTTEQGLGKLLKGRSDIYVEQTMVARHALSTLTASSEDAMSIYSAGMMANHSSFVSLHKKHSKLLGPLAGVLRQMKQEGTIDRFKKMAMKDLKRNRIGLHDYN